jgi:hypothetical protein
MVNNAQDLRLLMTSATHIAGTSDEFVLLKKG